MGFLRGVMAQCDVLALQEVHVNGDALRIELAPMLGAWEVAMSAHADIASGGTAVLVRRAAFMEGAEISSEELHKGRILMVRIAQGDAVTSIAAVHNYGMSVAEVNSAAATVRAELIVAQQAPLTRMLIMIGDFNFDAPDEAPWRSTGGFGVHRPGPASLRSLAASMVEMQQRRSTRCELANGIVHSRIDRIYISVPGWLLLAMSARAWASGDPVLLHRRGISDHVPVVAQLLPRARQARGERRLPQWLAGTDEYAMRLKAYEEAAQLGDMPTWERLALQKAVIREAATRAMRAINDEGGAEGIAPARARTAPSLPSRGLWHRRIATS